MIKLRRSILLLLFALHQAGCAGVPYPPGTPMDNAPLAAILRGKIADARPAACRSLHRAILTAGDRQFTFTAYVLFQPPGEIRCIGMDDFGGTLFDFLCSAQEETRILRNDRGLPRSWLTQRIARDLAVVYAAAPSLEARLLERADNLVCLSDKLPDGTEQEFCFDKGSLQLRAYVRAAGGKCRYRIDVLPPPASTSRPVMPHTSIRVTDYAQGYELALDLVQRRHEPFDAKLLKGGQ